MLVKSEQGLNSELLWPQGLIGVSLYRFWEEWGMASYSKGVGWEVDQGWRDRIIISVKSKWMMSWRWSPKSGPMIMMGWWIWCSRKRIPSGTDATPNPKMSNEANVCATGVAPWPYASTLINWKDLHLRWKNGRMCWKLFFRISRSIETVRGDRGPGSVWDGEEGEWVTVES